MPAMHFQIRWTDGKEAICYSPSLIIKDYLVPGTVYPVDDFMQRMRAALAIASDRVREKFGFACSRASDQLAELEEMAEHYGQPRDTVTVIAFSEL